MTGEFRKNAVDLRRFGSSNDSIVLMGEGTALTTMATFPVALSGSTHIDGWRDFVESLQGVY